jgi:hypothetical protein
MGANMTARATSARIAEDIGPGPGDKGAGNHPHFAPKFDAASSPTPSRGSSQAGESTNAIKVNIEVAPVFCNRLLCQKRPAWQDLIAPFF